jgi:hypothetical protein
MRASTRSGGHLIIAAVIGMAAACAPTMRSTVSRPLDADELRQLWVEPADITTRDLFHGPGGKDGEPDPNAVYTVTGVDSTGYSRGYDVEDPEGDEWKVKLGNEVQPEIVASRLLWAIGFHQPPTYYVASLQLAGGNPEDQGRAARLRSEEGYRTETDWSWQENPYVGTQPFKGLLVANLILNNWDLKTSNNRIYLLSGEAAAPARRFVVQDLGASLGKTRWPVGNRNDIDDFESQKLVRRIDGRSIRFDYHGRHGELFEDLTAADVAWTCSLLARLTDSQWTDAFRAARYPEAIADRYIAKLKAKIQEGLALKAQAAAR